MRAHKWFFLDGGITCFIVMFCVLVIIFNFDNVYYTTSVVGGVGVCYDSDEGDLAK
jgi:hypothetical protein